MGSDTVELKARLRQLYEDGSKHARYQNVPDFVREVLGYTEAINEEWRGDTARYRYLRSALGLHGQRVVDVGANTGFFTLSLAHEFKDSTFIAMEGNRNHVVFIQSIVDTFGMTNVAVQHSYVCQDNLRQIPECDTVLLLNVLHHAGVDFDPEHVAEPADVADYTRQYLVGLSARAKRVVFQMGYNWGGNKKRPIVPLADDVEKVIYTSRLLAHAGWIIKRIAIAHKIDEHPTVTYRDLAHDVVSILNRGRKDNATVAAVRGSLHAEMAELSEFYRRPMFLCENRRVCHERVPMSAERSR